MPGWGRVARCWRRRPPAPTGGSPRPPHWSDPGSPPPPGGPGPGAGLFPSREAPLQLCPPRSREAAERGACYRGLSTCHSPHGWSSSGSRTPGQPACKHRSRCCLWRCCNWRCPHTAPKLLNDEAHGSASRRPRHPARGGRLSVFTQAWCCSLRC